MSSSSAYGVNSLRIGDSEYLLTVASGWAVHLVPEAADAEDRRPAAAVEDLDPSTPGFNPAAAGYDRDALTAMRWRPTTLCGREWGIMAAGELGPIHRWSSADMKPDLAPTCRTCLRSIDRFFPPPAMDDRVRLLAHLAADAVVEHGSAEITGIPGDQLRGFRSRVRQELRRRGFHSNTLVHGDRCLVVSEEAHNAIPQEIRDQRFREALASIPNPLLPDSKAEEPVVRDRPWCFDWEAWEIPS
jgi:hypothetical protein